MSVGRWNPAKARKMPPIVNFRKRLASAGERSVYLGDGNDLLKKLSSKAKELGCSPDDVVDATCMAVTAAMKAHDMCETVPAEPEKDSTGLLMQMIVPKMMR